MKSKKIISFDIYDTLIERVVPVTKIYELLAKKYDIPNFLELRVKAEHIAKKENINYTINDIYKNIDLKNKKDILKDEIKLEIINTRKNVIGEKIYNKYKDNYKLICISDMYLPKEAIEEILNKNEYDRIDEIFVSCEYNASKRDRKLFKIVKNKYKNYHIVHVGDSIRSDFANAIFSGFRTNFIGKNNNKNYSKKLNKNEYSERIGYSIFGPMIFEFCIWLKNQNCDHLVFLSREGDLLRTCYSEVFNKEEDILYVSRKSVLSGIMFSVIKNRKLEKVIEQIKKQRKESIYDFLKRIGLLNENIFCGSFLNDNVNDENIKEIINLVYKNEKVFFDMLEEKNEIFSKYVETIINSNPSVVDVGWNGSMQDLLNLYFEDKYSFDGFYLGCMNSNGKKGFLFNDIDDNSLSILNYSGILELIFMPVYGSVLGYRKEKNKILPIHDTYEFTDESKEIITSIQRGYLNYINDRKKIGLVSLYSSDEIIENINKLGLKPNSKDIKYFGNIEFYDNEKTEKLVNYSHGIIKSFMKSEWKIAFLKKMFKIPMPYNKFLLMIRRSVKK